MPMVMSAQQRQDILLYCAKGFNTKKTRDAMLLDAHKLHGFQVHSVPSLHHQEGSQPLNKARGIRAQSPGRGMGWRIETDCDVLPNCCS